jgi:tetraprenyl-beta-curcumene synthase
MLATLRTLIAYEAIIVPHARREIRRWARIAATIPDPTLRAHATDSITVDASNAEAVAAFAALAPRRLRRTTIELLVTYQLLVDYVDTLGERVCAEQLRSGLAIGSALAAAVAVPASPVELDPLGDDGGYLAALVAACRTLLWQLPSAAVIAPQAQVAAVRCGHALAYTHTAAERGSVAELRRWAMAQTDAGDYSWWEIAAGGNSSIAILALLGAAADPLTTRCDADAVAAAYWPHICVVSTMLDSLVDYERDATTGDFSFVSHYPHHSETQHGVIRAAINSLEATRILPHRHTHAMIVCGVAGYYAAGAADGTLGSQIAPSLLTALRPTVTPIVLALRTQRRLRAGGG